MTMHRILVFATWFCGIVGCSGPVLKPVDPDLARQSLVETLDTWQQGGSIAELRKHTPEIVVQDPAWSGGSSLVEYRLVDQGRVEDANLFCEVELMLSKPGDKAPASKTVTYVIGTTPVITVFRAIL